MAEEKKIIEPGKWFARFDENGNVTEAVYSDSYRRVLGWESREEYPDSQESWESRLHPEDKERVQAYWTDILAKHPEGLDCDIEYRMLTKWGYHWFHEYASFVRLPDGSPVNCEGVVFDLQETIDRQARLAAQEAMQENTSRMLLLEDNFVILFDVDLETGAYDEYVKGQRYSNDIRTQLVEYREFFADTLKNVDRIVYPEDRAAFNRVINRGHIRAALEENNRLDCYYRQIIGGRPVWCKMRIVYKDAEQKRIIIGIFNAEEEMAEKEKNERLQTELMNRMSGEDGLFLINLVTDKKKTLHDQLFREGNVSDEENYSEFIMRYVSNFVAEIDRPLMKRAVSPEYIRERLKTEDEFEVEYRDMSSGVQQFFVMKIAKFSDTEVLQSFSNQDKEILDRLLFSKLEEDFYALFVVDLDTGLLQVMKTSMWYNSREVGDIVSYTQVVRAMAAEYEGETREFFERISDIGYLKQRFMDEDKITYSFKSRLFDSLRWVSVLELVLDRHEDGSPSRFAVGFSLLDAEASEKAELQRQLQEALRSAEIANRSKTSFLFNMSHDIRTPMNAIIGFTTMAKKYLEDKEKVADYLNKIDVSGQQLLNLINQVLEMSRIESGNNELDEVPVNIRNEFDQLVTVLEEQAKVNGLDFHSALIDIRHFNILADKARMIQITLNIVGNALKFTPKGGKIDFILQERPCDKDGYARFTFTVADTGIGMSEEYLKVLYEPFSREKSSTVSHIQGTGLGMSIVRNLVDLLDGTIEVESELGKGTRFDITFDFKLAEEESSLPEGSGQPDVVSFEGKRVLLVEDNELNREIAKDILEEFGLIVEEADDGDVAVEMVKAADERGEYDYYKLVMMDIQMPKMNGYDATRAIRALPDPTGGHLPIVAMTANAFEEDRKNAFAAGLDDHLAKPIDINKLKEALIKFL